MNNDDKNIEELDDVEPQNLNDDNSDMLRRDNNFSPLNEVRDNLRRGANNVIKNALPNKKNEPGLGDKLKVSPKASNPGKKLLNNNGSVAKPNLSPLDKDKKDNEGRLKEQLKKNNARLAGAAVSAGAALASNEKKKKEEKEEKDKKKKEKEKKKKNKGPLSRKNDDNSEDDDADISSKFNILNDLGLENSFQKSKVLSFLLRHPILMFIIFIIIFSLMLLIVIFTVIEGDKIDMDGSSYSFNGDATCGGFSLVSTTLSRDDFISKVKSYNSSNSNMSTFASKAGDIYDISKKNNFNPELVVTRAIAEGFSPGSSKNNYWGIGCTNNGGYGACKTYSSFDQGVLGFINTMQSYNVSTLFDVYNKAHYAHIGGKWYSPGSSGQGGCYYLPYVKKYMSASRYSTVKASCDAGTQIKTNDEDQAAYSHYQIEAMLNYRQNVFGIGEEECSNDDENSSDNTSDSNASVSGSGIGAKVAAYAVNKFDSFGYLYGASRSSEKYVDCSAVTYRSYKHFGIDISGTSAGQYSWCKNNGKMIKESELQAGDLLLKSGHVEMYIGNGKRFGAHTAHASFADQVSISPYRHGYFTSFCRPTK